MKTHQSARVVECVALEARRLLCTLDSIGGMGTVPGVAGEHDQPAVLVSAQSIDQLNVPAFSSRPSAGRKLYLDFNGHPMIENWNGWACCGKDAGPTPAYDIDADPFSFSAQELDNIERIWKGVAEKFSPFNIDVTTIAPSKINGARIVIGGDGSWYGQGGGVAVVGGWGEEGFFDVNGANVAFVWGRPTSPAYVAEAVAHEAGHTLDLHHQSRSPFTDGNGDIIAANEYLPGLIMGRGDTGIGRWAHTSFTGPGGVSSGRDGRTIVSRGGQDDLNRITDDNGFGFRVDDAGNTIATAASLPITLQNGVLQGAVTGVIERMTDLDVYRIEHSGGSIDIEVLAAEFRRMLDPSLQLLNSAGTVIQSSFANNGSDGIGERIQIAQLNAGTYFLRIAGSGAYGDVGQYRLNVRAGIPQANNDTLGTATVLGAFGRTTAEFIALGFAGTANISDSLVSSDVVDYFKVTVPASASGVLSARVSGVSGGGVALDIINDRNGDGIVGATEFVSAPPLSGGTTSLSQSMFGSDTRFVRVTRTGAAVNAYQLRITVDTAPAQLNATVPSQAQFDPQPLHAGRLVNESIDALMPDTTDYYRVTAAAGGLFSFTLFPQDNTGDLRLDVGADTNGNGVLDAGEILASSAQVGVGAIEQINNLAVTSGQRLLVRVSQQTNTSDNYILQAVADYATGGNTTGALTSATDLTTRSAASIREHLGGIGDVFDTYRLAPPAGPLMARITPLQLGASHRLEVIRDANGNGAIDHGEIIASGFNTTFNLTVPNPGLLPVFYYLRVASVASGGEFPSVGNYNLTFITASAKAGRTLALPQTISPISTPRTAGGYLAFDPDDAGLTDLDDYYQFTLTSRTRFDVSTSDPTFGVQVGVRDEGRGGSIFVQVGGIGMFQGTVNALSVNLDPGTYLVRTYLSLPEREDTAIGGNFTLTFKTAEITDTSPPLVTASEFQYEIRPVGVIFTLDQDVLGSIDPEDVVIRNLETNATFPIGETYYDPVAFKVGYGVAAGTLPDGNYRATLLAGSIRDASANPLEADVSFDFFVFAGDANRDRTVNIADFAVMGANFNQLSTFSQGDFNYDHFTTIADFSILASKFNTSLPQPGERPGAPSSKVLIAATNPFSRRTIGEPIASDVLGPV